jgi:hypothetical protein
MANDRDLRSILKQIHHRLVQVVACGLLVTACTNLPATYPVTGVVAGAKVEIAVDSEVAAYYVSAYLAEDRRRPDLDRRIDALYQEFGNPRLPNHAQLKRIADEFSVDFAAIYFADLIERVPANRLLRETYKRHFDQATAAHMGAEQLRLVPGATGYDMVFVPGYHYITFPDTGADLAAPRTALHDAGLATNWIETDQDGTVDANAELVAEYLSTRARLGSQIIVVSASKSGPEVGLALGRLSQTDARHVKAWINIVGTLQGTPLADELLGDGFLSHYSGIVRDAGLQSLTTAEGRVRYGRFKTHDRLLTINYMAIPVTGTISDRARDTYSILRPYGPNDGLTLLPDLIAPNSVILVEFGRDHYLVDETIGPRTVALVNTTVEWLENCRTDQGSPSWTEIETAHCSLE